jgi:3-isopropylmalate/(R)-2-methylmalate dehydratase small subunit
MRIDLHARHLEVAGERFGFALAPREELLLTEDIDWIGATLAQRDRIADFEHERLARQPWLDRIYPT